MFEPHFMHRKCDSPPESQACRDACIHHGRYCAFDSINATYAATFKPRHVRMSCFLYLHSKGLERKGARGRHIGHGGIQEGCHFRQ